MNNHLRLLLAVITAFLLGFLVRGVNASAPQPAVHPVRPSVFESAAPQSHTLGAGGGLRTEAPLSSGETRRGAEASLAPKRHAGGASPPSSPAATASSVAAKPKPATSSPKRAPSTAASGRTTHRVTGTASWYCLPGRSVCTRGYEASGPYAAAGPALRVGNWRGRWVTVNGIRLRLVDWCACPRRVIDVYGSQFAKLAPLSRGIVSVEVRW